MANKTLLAKWCFLRSNGKISRAVKSRMKDRKLSQASVCRELDITPYRLSLYLSGKSPNLNQHQLYKICEVLGFYPSIVLKEL